MIIYTSFESYSSYDGIDLTPGKLYQVHCDLHVYQPMDQEGIDEMDNSSYSDWALRVFPTSTNRLVIIPAGDCCMLVYGRKGGRLLFFKFLHPTCGICYLLTRTIN